ncbi:MAG: thiamine pyrophosphate-requiring protein [Pseudomonadota bacterium]
MHRSPRSVAEAFLYGLKSRGVDWIFGNAGTDFAPIIEAMAAAEDDPLPMPRAVEIIHETVAVAMAHGYYLMTGKPQCAMVHVNVGVANGLMGIINASRGNVPVMFASGRTPITEDGRLGSRNAPIHWGQEMFDQGGILREFVKWDNELRAGEQVVDMVDRALAISQADPKGPVYLSLPREVLAERLPGRFDCAAQSTQAVPSSPHPDPAAVTQVRAWLEAAERPLVITSDGNQALFDVLGPFAERAAIPVAQFWRTSPAISTRHPMYAGETPRPHLADADLVLVLDAMVPWMPGRMPVAEGARIVQVAADPMYSGLPVRSFPADLAVTATAASFVAALDAELAATDHATRGATVARRVALTTRLARRREEELAGAGKLAPGEPISPEFMTRALSEVVGDDAVIVNELGLAPGVLDITRADGFFGLPTSGGLGWAGGTALGAKLACPERTVVWATGDGSYTFSNPGACHHAAASLGLGLLTVIADNRVWNAVRRSTIAVYPQGAAAQTDVMPLTSLEPAPDYTHFVKAFGGHGETVEKPEALHDAFARALAITRSGRQAVVAVRCTYPDALKL